MTHVTAGCALLAKSLAGIASHRPGFLPLSNFPSGGLLLPVSHMVPGLHIVGRRDFSSPFPQMFDNSPIMGSLRLLEPSSWERRFISWLGDCSALGTLEQGLSDPMVVGEIPPSTSYRLMLSWQSF